MKEHAMMKMQRLDNTISRLNETYGRFKHDYAVLVDRRNTVLAADTVDNYDLAMVDYIAAYDKWVNRRKMVEQLLLEVKKEMIEL